MNLVFSDSQQFDPSLQTNAGNINSVFLQISYILLVSLGLTYAFESNPSFLNYSVTLFKVLILYLFQVIGFYLISSMINLKTESFHRNRFVINEVNALFLFVALFLIIYLPIKVTGVIHALLGLSAIFNLIGSSRYLASNISNFHIILYLCTLEIIPVLLLLKFI